MFFIYIFIIIFARLDQQMLDVLYVDIRHITKEHRNKEWNQAVAVILLFLTQTWNGAGEASFCLSLFLFQFVKLWGTRIKLRAHESNIVVLFVYMWIYSCIICMRVNKFLECVGFLKSHFATHNILYRTFPGLFVWRFRFSVPSVWRARKNN